jgi:thymidylate synthase
MSENILGIEMNYKEILHNKPRNSNYILRDFDENLAKVMDNGYDMNDRTGTGCRYLPGIVTTIDISERVPVPTLRATKWKSMLAEYLWFLTGSDRISDLREKFGSKVWDYWQKSEWAKSKDLSEDSIGYGYGPNLIKFGEDISIYSHDDVDFFTPGFNQIDHVINLLKTNPNSRRILFSFFRPDKQGPENTVLDPCHLIYQFIPEPNKKLSCCVYIRSNDLFVGALSTNLQGAAFYTHMIGQQTGFTPSKLIVMSAHAHIYHNHFDAVKEYLTREEVNSPILKLNKRDSIYDYTLDDFELIDYNPLTRIKVEIAV